MVSAFILWYGSGMKIPLIIIIIMIMISPVMAQVPAGVQSSIHQITGPVSKIQSKNTVVTRDRIRLEEQLDHISRLYEGPWNPTTQKVVLGRLHQMQAISKDLASRKVNTTDLDAKIAAAIKVCQPQSIPVKPTPKGE